MKNCFRIGIGIAACLAVSLVSAASAADMPVKAPARASIFDGYPIEGKGIYFGVNTLGGAASVTGSAPGVNPNSLTSNEIGVGFQVGYSYSPNKNVFIAAEAMFNVRNFNGAQAGFSFGGPWSFEQRIKIGTPLAGLLNLLPNNPFGNLTAPPFQNLPAGQVATNVHPYMMVGVYEEDISINYALASNKEWRIGPVIGVGVLAQLTSGVAIDTWTQVKPGANDICIGPNGACVKNGPKYEVGVALHF